MMHLASVKTKLVLINTAIIYLQDSQNKKRPFHAILDSAAQSNFISSEAANLGIKKEKINILISRLNDSSFNIKFCMTTCLSNLNGYFKCSVDLLIVLKITGIPHSRISNISDLNFSPNLTLADPHFYEPNKVRILLGAELFFYFLKEGKICLKINNLIFQNTCFGYIVIGSIVYSEIGTTLFSNKLCFLSMEDINNSIKKFWEAETIDEGHNAISDELSLTVINFKKLTIATKQTM